MVSSRTLAVILRRINYGEADRILTLLTRDFGKIALIAKGVRKEKSKLAGGIELFSESDISFIKGKGDIGTLVSTQLSRHFGDIHTDLTRMQIASDFLKRINIATESDASSDYYDLVVQMMIAMNTPAVPPDLVGAWATIRLLLLMGEVINVESDASNKPFSDESTYRFSYEQGRFIPDQHGLVEPSLIKFLRLLGSESPARIMAVKGADELGKQAYALLDLAYQYNRPQSQSMK